MNKFREKLTYANVMSTLAVFMLLGGGAYAAGLAKNSVGKKQLKKNAVTSKAIAKQAVRTSDIKKQAVRSKTIKDGDVLSSDLGDGVVGTSKIADNAVTGPKVDESSLGEVPLAAFAAGNNIRAAFSEGNNVNIPGSGGNQTVQTVTINAPVAGMLLINGGLRPDNNNGSLDIYSCDLLVNGSLLGASSRGTALQTASVDESCETSAGVDVAAGDHTVNLRGVGIGAGNEIEDATLQALFIPGA